MRGAPFLGGYLLLYAVALTALVVREHFGLEEPLFVLAIFGGVFPMLAWAVTRRTQPLPVEAPGTAGILVYLVVVALFIARGLDFFPFQEPAQDLLKTAAKVVVLVVVPAVLFRTRLQIRWSRSDTAVTLVLGAVLIGFQIVLGSGLRRLATVRLSTAEIVITTVGALVWMAISAGLVEEYFFRAALQTRMERASGSTLGGIVIAALLFGLIHAPGLYLRSGLTNENVGSHPSLLLAVGYSIVIVSPAGLFFGVLWSRTRNILLLVVLHGVGDLIPNLANFARNFHV